MRTKMAAACAALIGHCAMAQSTDVTLYGVVDLGLRNGSGLTASNAPTAGSSHSLGSGIHTTSRWGLRGSEDLGGGAKALFNLESGLNADTGAPANATKPGKEGQEGWERTACPNVAKLQCEERLKTLLFFLQHV